MRLFRPFIAIFISIAILGNEAVQAMPLQSFSSGWTMSAAFLTSFDVQAINPPEVYGSPQLWRNLSPHGDHSRARLGFTVLTNIVRSRLRDGKILWKEIVNDIRYFRHAETVVLRNRYQGTAKKIRVLPGITLLVLAVAGWISPWVASVGATLSGIISDTMMRREGITEKRRDPLTGLFTRKILGEEDSQGRFNPNGLLPTLFRRATDKGFMGKLEPVTMIWIDLDKFGDANARLGDSAGDHYLREFGRFLNERVRADDLAIRDGGEEFIILLPNTDLEGGKKAAEILRQKIREFQVDVGGGNMFQVTASIGVAQAFNYTPSFDLKTNLELWQKAGDAASLSAKQEDPILKVAGRNRVVIVPPPGEGPMPDLSLRHQEPEHGRLSARGRARRFILDRLRSFSEGFYRQPGEHFLVTLVHAAGFAFLAVIIFLSVSHKISALNAFLFSIFAERTVTWIQHRRALQREDIDSRTGVWAWSYLQAGHARGRLARWFEAVGDSVSKRRRYNPGLTAIGFDIDHFKQVNDQQGHLFGNDVLAAIANKAEQVVGAENIVVRKRGKRFFVFVHHPDVAEGLAIAEKLRQAIQDMAISVVVENKQAFLTLSLAVANASAQWSSHGTSLNQEIAAWLEAVENGIEDAKKPDQNGQSRNRVVLVNPPSNEQVGGHGVHRNLVGHEKRFSLRRFSSILMIIFSLTGSWSPLTNLIKNKSAVLTRAA